ncbi:hypothetical protein [Haloglomus salinum]|jgi:hypothetical protein|uniref:hypothetical protein n=1 Tax=Haloglomus salinum TaxID=2962673 RepID=UPI0020CA1E12|nr:hypothetical protein [Haloglomus salinum]
MSFTTRERGVLAGVLVLVVTGSGLIVAPVGPTEPPMRSTSIADCELVQLAVYELDEEPPDERERSRYRALNETQQTVFDEGRAANGSFVRFQDRDRMAAADTLPPYVVFDGRNYRAHSIRGNCVERPWYGDRSSALGYLLVGLGLLLGGVFSWRRITD